jgi:uncharacterized membrane protein
MAVGVLAATVVASGCVHDLGPAGFDGTAHDINKSGMIVGERRSGDYSTAFVRAADGVYTDLRVPADLADVYSSSANAVNDDGVVVGVMGRSDGLMPGYPFRWTMKGGLEVVRLPDGYAAATAVDVASDGTMLVNAYHDWYYRPFLYEPSADRYTELPTFGEGAEAQALNNGGQVVGAARVDHNPHAVVWDAGTHKVHDLDTGGFQSVANDVNESGVVTGYVSHIDNGNEAVIWAGPDHERRTLGMGEGRGINESGIVVGFLFDPSASDADRVAQARLWDSVTGAAVALDDKGRWSEANAVNDESVPVGSMDAGTDPTHSSADVRIVKWDAYKRAPAA